MRTFLGQKENSINPCLKIAVLLWIAIFLFIQISESSSVKCPSNLWMGLIAEDTSGDYQTYLAIASVVRNRLNKGLNHGLVALRRKNLIDFVADNYLYMLHTKDIDLEELAKTAIVSVFAFGKDYVNGATHYEHTGVYPIPSDVKNMKLVKVLYPNTKKEITFWK